jgi:hypothetical protein
MREGIEIEVTAADRDRLERVVADRNSPQKHVWRARIILATAEGCGTAAIMRQAGVSKPCVWRWQERFMREGVAGLLRDKTRKPGLPPLPPALVDRVVELTLADPPGEATHWTGRAMAAATGISLRSVQRIWAAHGLEPHRVRRFKLSTDPAFAAKLRDVVGLYLDPPAHAVVLSVDEKSQIQALDRTQPGLPMKKGRAGTMTHDYVRNGTTTLFAALNVLDGSVIGQCMARHRHQELIRFLNRIEATVPAGKLVHAILDNYAAHKHPKVRAWLARHPRWTSTSHRPPVLGPTPSRPSSQPSPAVGSSAVSSLPWSTPRPPSTAISTSTTGRPNPSSGPPIPIASSRRSIEGIKRWRPTTRSAASTSATRAACRPAACS